MPVPGSLECATCRTTVRRTAACVVERAAMQRLAAAGFGDVVPLLDGQPESGRRDVFERFAAGYPTAWHLCPACVALARPYGLAPPSPAAGREPRRLALRRRLAAVLGGRAGGIAGRVALGLLGLVFLAAAPAIVADTPATIVVPGGSRRWPVTVANGPAGLARVTALWAAIAGALLANIALRRRSGHGPVDFVLNWLAVRGFPVLGFDALTSAAIFGLIAGVWLAVELLFRTVIHWSPEAAAAAFLALPERLSVAVTGGIAFLADAAGQRHLAAFTPDFVRAFEAQAPLGVLDRPPEFQAAGLLPIVALLVLGLVQAWRAWPLADPGEDLAADTAADRIVAQTLLGVVLVSLYVALWTGAVQSGIFDADPAVFRVRQTVIDLALVLATCGAVVVVATWRQLAAGISSIMVRRAWVGLVAFASLVSATLPYLYGSVSPGSPAKLWLLTWWLAATPCWLALGVRWMSAADIALADAP